MNHRHGTDLHTGRRNRRKADQVGVVKRIGFFDFRQALARYVKLEIA